MILPEPSLVPHAYFKLNMMLVWIKAIGDGLPRITVSTSYHHIRIPPIPLSLLLSLLIFSHWPVQREKRPLKWADKVVAALRLKMWVSFSCWDILIFLRIYIKSYDTKYIFVAIDEIKVNILPSLALLNMKIK